MRAGRRDVPLTHPDKVLFPDDGITKADLAAYYRDAAPRMVDLVRDRPVSLQRFNDGIAQAGLLPEERRARGAGLGQARAGRQARRLAVARPGQRRRDARVARQPELHHAARLALARGPPRAPGPDDLRPRPGLRRRLRARAPHRARARRRPARGRRRALRDDDGLQGASTSSSRCSAATPSARCATPRWRSPTELVARQAQGPDDRVLQAQARRAAVRRRQSQRLRGDGRPALRVRPLPGAPVATPLALGRALRPAPARAALDDPHGARPRSRRVEGVRRAAGGLPRL